MKTNTTMSRAKSAKNNGLTKPGRMLSIQATSLLSVSTAGRGAASSGAAPALFLGSRMEGRV